MLLGDRVRKEAEDLADRRWQELAVAPSAQRFTYHRLRSRCYDLIDESGVVVATERSNEFTIGLSRFRVDGLRVRSQRIVDDATGETVIVRDGSCVVVGSGERLALTIAPFVTQGNLTRWALGTKLAVMQLAAPDGEVLIAVRDRDPRGIEIRAAQPFPVGEAFLKCAEAVPDPVLLVAASRRIFRSECNRLERTEVRRHLF